uniref:Uncharacterized protein n=1 Tax=Arundo donax TaxID=35708 RepID=A0A0A9GC82_ARUDO
MLELSFISVIALLKHSFDTCETSSDIFTFASSRFAGPKFCFPRVSCACSRTACRYFPWASIRSCRCLCTSSCSFSCL